ncbi:alpha-amylase family protein [Arachidicoccus terrestris]|uniref:hypothetical protein n=1 Tax=Arachidicoccus terrestris TaxID=2875539 RepID=UPI001CC4666A|nr:hypothetical protein [Arachidicoccus terrestris]UAY56866.1 hypothetical protein K9M52_07710 [Arachidicoccus terrestris]
MRYTTSTRSGKELPVTGKYWFNDITMKSVYLLIFLVLALSVKNGYCKIIDDRTVNNKDAILRIPFGQNNVIIYHLATGSYDVTFYGGVNIRQATAIAGMADTLGDVRPLQRSADMAYVRYTKTPVSSPLGHAVLYKILRKTSTGVLMEQDFTVFTSKDYFLVKARFSHVRGPVNYCSPLSAATIDLDWAGENYTLRCPFDNDMWARYETARLDTVHFVSSEVSTVFNADRAGLVIGSLEHKIWKSGIRLESTSAHSLRLTAFGGYTNATVTHDRRPHGVVRSADGSTCSPQMMVGYFGDWRTGMEAYAKNNRLTEPPFIQSWKGATPVGWNSWGVLQDKIDLPSAKGVVDFFADSCKLFRTKDRKLFIDLDSYWDRMIKNGLGGDVGELKSFVDYCKSRGFEPGIYWAPFTDWGKQGSRRVEGSDYTYQDCWTSINGKPLDVDGGRAMDPTHPATRRRIIKYIGFFKSMGFKMIKIDFLGHATLEADHYYDPQVKTGMEAFCSGMEFLDSLLDNKMLVYAAISPNLATARYVHMRRIACDAFKSISETAYALNSLTYGWWQSHLYDYMDADHVVFKGGASGENRARLASAVMTGTLITGDDYSKPGPWRTTARRLLQNQALLALVGLDGKSFMPYTINVGNGAGNIFEKRVGDKLYLGVFNYAAQPGRFNVLYSKLGVKSPSKVTMIMGGKETKCSLSSQALNMELPKQDAAIFCLEP